MTPAERRNGQPLYLAIDQGGHASRALIFDRSGACVAAASVPIRVTEPQPGQVEHDAEEVIESLRAAVARACAAVGARAADIAAAGLACQRASVVCWDRRSGAALTPVLSWRDRRAARCLPESPEHSELIRQRTGLRPSPHYGASKLRWCLEQVSAVRAAQERGALACGPLASFILFRLLEERPLLADAANASRTLLWNPALCDWDTALLELFAIPRTVLPSSVATRHAFGTLRSGPLSIPVTVACGDQSAALFALGAPDPDSVYINLGTGAFAQRLWTESTGAAPPGLLLSVVRQEQARLDMVLEGTVNGAACALEVNAQRLGVSLETLYRELPLWLERIDDPPLYLNGDGGLGAPFWVADFASRHIGAGDARAQLVAVAESMVFLLRVVLDAMHARLPCPRRIVVSGGLAVLDGVCRRLADVCEVPVYRPAAHEASARGLAYLLADAPARWREPRSGCAFEPQASEAFAARFARWRAALHEALETAGQQHA